MNERVILTDMVTSDTKHKATDDCDAFFVLVK